MKNKLSAIVLAGGKATRLGGVDKGLFEYQGKPLIEHVIDRIKPQVADIVISANRNEQAYQRYANKVINDGNLDYAGPLIGISKAIPECQQSKILVCTCDMPLLPHDLMDYFDLDSSNDLQVINIDGHRQLCWLMRAGLLTSLNDYIKQGGQRVMQWLASCHPVDIHIANENQYAFKNFNNLEDFS